MSSEIQFGDLQQTEPEKDIRPDCDAHFSVVPCGNAVMPGAEGFAANELMIFVDLDVMRDMEGHAGTDTTVELGGVMLGRQRVDENGIPFVVVTDSLRAEHYHATKGNFTFTHDTWSRITQQREQYRPDLEMVGWYHTHPGHTVFLSGLDMFICNNFFNKPLDLALVIDPINDDRGWFQWIPGRKKQTRRTSGFYLMANRHRQDELNYFSSLYTRGKTMNVDPRFSTGTLTGSSQPIVNIMESERRPLIDVAIVTMLTFQFLLIGMLVWRMMLPAVPAQLTAEDATQSAVVSVRQQEQEAILNTIVANQTGEEDLVKKYLDLKEENYRLLSNLDGQLTLVESVKVQKLAAEVKLEEETEKSGNLKANLGALMNENKDLAGKVETLTVLAKEKGLDPEQAGVGSYLKYLWWLLAAVVGAIGGFFIGRRRGLLEADEYFGDDPSDSSQRNERSPGRSMSGNRSRSNDAAQNRSGDVSGDENDNESDSETDHRKSDERTRDERPANSSQPEDDDIQFGGLESRPRRRRM